ncbi:two-component system response regulator GlrR [Thorsellia kenyensis]|uniref:Two-component system response regulator GlrR n=1 Tax=Thorsellia kenyensis TaxID=1549888 RepID=A0ABV6C918_9GAMM
MSTTKQAHILLVDDDPNLLKLLGIRLKSEGFVITTALSGQEALKILNKESIDLVISDLKMDEMDGLDLFVEVQKSYSGLPVIILTAHGSIPDAVLATQQGVFGFLTKPVDKDALYKAIENALAQSFGNKANGDEWDENFITKSPIMLQVIEQAKMVALSEVSILINGASGTGKEVLAKAIHQASHRKNKPFIAINCGALPEQLLESELFGHTKGSFTGAVANRDGLFKAADGGTLFLDEIGDMPFSLQVKLLRVIQERKVRPLGANSDIDIDVRIISATHRNLIEAMEKNEFREDLYYRLNVVNLKLPTLNERSEDVPLLANLLLKKIAAKNKPSVKSFSPEALKKLASAKWPGNIRQLVNVIEQCVAITNATVINDTLIDKALQQESNSFTTLTEAKNQFEATYLKKILHMTKGNVTQAARLSDRNRTELYKLFAKHDLDPQDFK